MKKHINDFILEMKYPKEKHSAQMQALKTLANKLESLGFEVKECDLKSSIADLPKIVLAGKDTYNVDFSHINLGKVKNEIESVGAEVVEIERAGKKSDLVSVILSEKIIG